jgi:hypothetical protein
MVPSAFRLTLLDEPGSARCSRSIRAAQIVQGFDYE